MKLTIVEAEDNPCESCKFEKTCRWARDYKVVDCKDWTAKEEDN